MAGSAAAGDHIRAMALPPASHGASFPSTRWSRLLVAPDERDLEALARAYYRPIRAWLAARFRLREHDADDLAQEAFAWMLSTRLLDKADPARGRFRGFLKTSLARFAIDRFRRDEAAKRGAGRAHEPLDAAAGVADAAEPSPDARLDEAWRRELIDRAREELERELESTGRRQHWLLFRDWFLEEGDGEPDQAALARRHGVTKVDVSNRLAYAKRRFRELLRAQVAETVRDEEELRDELAWLFGQAP
jgi:RNA polymerase sigma-70 factor (ECF subfamily)